MLYRWPQGRVLRTIFIVIAVVAAVDLIYYGGMGSLDSYNVQQETVTEGGAAAGTSTLISAIVYFVLGAVALIGGIACIGFVPKTAGFLIEVEHEMSKVTWPKRSEVIRSSIMISIMTVVLTVLIFVIDKVNYALVIDGIFKKLGG